MESIKSYLLSVIIAALVVSILTSMLSKKSPYFKAVQMIGGLIVLITIIAPWKSVQLNLYESYYNDFKMDAENQAAYGKTAASESLHQIIKDQTEAYILDKASELDATLQVCVTLSNETYPTPIGASLKGNISPYAKKTLSRIIQKDLGIPEDKLTWT